MPFPNPTTQFKPGNPGRPKNAALISKRSARRLARLAIVAQVAGTTVPELMRLLGTPLALPRSMTPTACLEHAAAGHPAGARLSSPLTG